jgi:hypothetical protein
MKKQKYKYDWYFLGAALLFFILGGIYDQGLFYLTAWTMVIVEIFYIFIKTW